MKGIIVLINFLISASCFAVETSTLSPGTIDNSYKLNQTGVGLQGGAYNGVNVEYWYTPSSTFTAALADERGNAAVNVGHNWMFSGVFPGWANALSPYIGAGLVGVFGNKTDYFNRANSRDNFALAIHVPVGLEWLPKTQRFSIFGQISPTAEVISVFMGLLTADIGARFYF